MKVFAGSDHAGLPLKKKLLALLSQLGHDARDLGTHQETSCDYPDFAHAVAEQVLAEPGTAGLLVCGSGIGMSIAANRHAGIRAALCHDPLEARLCREHNDANVLVLGGRLIGEEMAAEILRVFCATAFSGGRHAGRIKKIEPHR